MTDKILKALEACGVKEYRIRESEKKSAELFFVRKRLDLRRSTNVKQYYVTIFNSFEKAGKAMKGSADLLVFPGTGEAELEAMIKSAYKAAGYVCNPTYDFGEAHREKCTTELTSLEEGVKVMTEALFAADNREDVFINSAELFVEQTKEHILVSNGSDVSFGGFEVKGEFVAQCREPQDVETYRGFGYRALEAEALTKLTEEVLNTTKARAIAKEAAKAGKYRVIISGRYVANIFDFYIERAASSSVYAGYSGYKVGDAVQGEVKEGEKLNITLKATKPYSYEAVPMKDAKLLEDGKLKLLHGGQRFAGYLGIEATGDYEAYELAAGKTPLAKMKAEPYLNVVNFSDFQMDSDNGHFGGEIRLAFLFDGEKEIAVTGGSISGNLLELQDKIVLSSEIQKEKNFTGPYAVCFDGISVAGR